MAGRNRMDYMRQSYSCEILPFFDASRRQTSMPSRSIGCLHVRGHSESHRACVGPCLRILRAKLFAKFDKQSSWPFACGPFASRTVLPLAGSGNKASIALMRAVKYAERESL
jgi:hypothetical protein